METLPCKGCRGLCCGPVAITDQELNKIKKKIKSMPKKIRSELANQHRHFGTCIFYDLEKDRCGIYSARPEVCRLFGHHKQLSCFRKPEMATLEHPDLKKRSSELVGTLSIDFTWKHF